MARRIFLSAFVLGALLSTAWSAPDDEEAPSFGIEFIVAERGSGAQVAAARDRFLVVWTEGPETSRTVFGRVYRATDGKPDGLPFKIAANLDESSFYRASPVVAGGADQFLVAWTQTPSSGTPPTEIRATRISLTGDVRDPGGLLIRDAGPNEGMSRRPDSPAVTWRGTDWFLAWVERAPGDHEPILRFSIVDPTGTFSSAHDTGARGCPRVVASSAGLLTVYWESDGEKTAAVLFGLDGAPQHGTMIGGESIPCEHDIASDGRDFLLVYGCSTDPSDLACAGATTGPRLFSVEIDGETGKERPETRRAISGQVGLGEYQGRRAALTFLGDRYIIMREEFYAGQLDIYLDDEIVLAFAEKPAVAGHGDTGFVVAHRPELGVVGRFFRFGATPGPSATPTPSPEATATSRPTPTDGVNSADAAQEGGCTCSTTQAHGPSPAAALLIAAISASRAWRRRHRAPGS